MIDLAWWLGNAHEEVEDLGNGMYRHIFTSPDASLKLYLPKPLIDCIRLTLKPGYPPAYEIEYSGDIPMDLRLSRGSPLTCYPRKLRKCHMRKIFKRRQMERRRYVKSE
jgi:hypothetical protein